MKSLILSVNEYIIRLALIEDGKISEFLIEDKKDQDYTGNFYKGKIEDVLENKENFFINIGLEKNAFLNLGKFKKRQNLYKDADILVQVEKNPRDEKGASVTLDYSIAGKNIVLLPNSRNISISNKIKNEKDIDRLKAIFSKVKDVGLIIRTSASTVNENELQKEYLELLEKWNKILEIYSKSKVGTLIFSQNSIIDRLFRNYLDESVDELIVDDEENFNKIKEYVLQKDLKIKINRYFNERDIFEFYSYNIDIENALRKKLWLESGAYLVIEKTEALVSIDVNTGRSIEAKNLKELIFKTNLEAAKEIPRQLRLRNLAGIIIIDFIDMKSELERKEVLKVLKENLKKDSEKTEVINYSSLNLVQLTRQRRGKELAAYYLEECPYCNGTGNIISEDRAILNLLKELTVISSDVDISGVEVIAKKEFSKKIKQEFSKYIEKIFEKRSVEIKFSENSSYLVNQYKINIWK
ncbi:MAG: Rne/Rng family ribonuclease [Fusobacterium gastrosuis]|uniref:Rne/Rng family ribonuclease n=1 Tax=Fusobacterium gastrosuis TaxID=1755100 RepID=UPI002A9AB252|nr:Rne/Rng family ribonuclease [Fusobacteriaceae bacterium]MDY5794385.1 Rne/Rng family ribonuclease [Fusobacterium gastrosuis]